jgi:hypothetical protein
MISVERVVFNRINTLEVKMRKILNQETPEVRSGTSTGFHIGSIQNRERVMFGLFVTFKK